MIMLVDFISIKKKKKSEQHLQELQATKSFSVKDWGIHMYNVTQG